MFYQYIVMGDHVIDAVVPFSQYYTTIDTTSRYIQ